MLDKMIELLKQLNEFEGSSNYEFMIDEDGNINLVLLNFCELEQTQLIGNVIDLSSVETRLKRKLELLKQIKENSENIKRTLYGD